MTGTAERQFHIELGVKIKVARINAKLTQEEFAKLLDLNRTSIVNIEKGRQSPPLYTLYLMANLLQVHITELLPGPIVRVLSDEFKSIINGETFGIKSSKDKLLQFVSHIPTTTNVDAKSTD